MAQKNQQNTSFRAAEGIYCYIMMPFRLKNAGATYQRMVSSIFMDQIDRTWKVILMTWLKRKDHTIDLEETFRNLRKNRMKLNPSKRTFGVTAGIFLGFMVSERGI